MVKEGVRAGWSLEGASEPLLPDPPPSPPPLQEKV